MDSSSTEPAKVRWYHLTPAKYLVALLLLVAFLVLSERFKWFVFNRQIGWTALMAVEYVGIGLSLLLAWIGAARLFGRKIQFGLNTILFAVIVAAIPLAWVAAEVHRARVQEATAVRFFARGSDPEWTPHYAFPSYYIWPVNALGRNYFVPIGRVTIRNHQDFEELSSFPHLHFVHIERLRLDEKDWKRLRVNCPKLEALKLRECQVSDDDAPFLSTFPELNYLVLSEMTVSTRWWDEIVIFPKLKSLWIEKTDVSEAMLEQFKQANPKRQVYQPHVQTLDQEY